MPGRRHGFCRLGIVSNNTSLPHNDQDERPARENSAETYIASAAHSGGAADEGIGVQESPGPSAEAVTKRRPKLNKTFSGQADELTKTHGHGSILSPLLWGLGICLTNIGVCGKYAQGFTWLPVLLAICFGVMALVAYGWHTFHDHTLLMTENERLTGKRLEITEKELTWMMKDAGQRALQGPSEPPAEPDHQG